MKDRYSYTGKLYLILAVCFIFILPIRARSQSQNAPAFIEFIDASVLTQQQDNYAQAWLKSPYVLEYAYCKINTDLLQKEMLIVDLPGGNQISIKKRKEIKRYGKMFSWFGSPQTGEGNINFVVNNENVTGWIFFNGGTYYIYPIGNGLHIVFSAVEDGLLAEKEDVDKIQEINKKIPIGIDPETGNAKLVAGSDCKIRVAVCYTDDVDATLADIAGFIQSCIDVTNECYANSAVNFEVELARSFQNTYSEEGDYVNDLLKFKDTADGVLDEISAIRIYYDADLCVLLVEDVDSACGRASTDNIASYFNSFCIVKRGCAIANQYTFPHELGHLYGCNHDPYITGDLFPYSYGHGKANPFDAGGWRTVMSYVDYCTDIGLTCGRIPYFSNPDINYAGVSTGTPYLFGEPTCDNAQVLNNSKDEISVLEATINNKILPSEIISGGEAGDVIAYQSVTHLGDYSINDGGFMTWRAGTSITLAEGFIAYEGSDFHAFIDECNMLTRLADTSPTQQEIIIEDGIKIYPNPFITSFSIELFTKQSCIAEIKMFDILGKEVMEILPSVNIEKGYFTVHADGGNLAQGAYIVKIKTDNKEITRNVIKIK